MHVLNATDQLAALERRDVSVAELVDTAIGRIEATDGGINAIVARDFERARAAARKADGERSRGVWKPLLGLPVTVKECFDVEGLGTSRCVSRRRTGCGRRGAAEGSRSHHPRKVQCGNDAGRLAMRQSAIWPYEQSPGQVQDGGRILGWRCGGRCNGHGRTGIRDGSCRVSADPGCLLRRLCPSRQLRNHSNARRRAANDAAAAACNGNGSGRMRADRTVSG